jgi:hypothetical protein
MIKKDKDKPQRPKRIPKRQLQPLARDQAQVERLFDLISKEKSKAESISRF